MVKNILINNDEEFKVSKLKLKNLFKHHEKINEDFIDKNCIKFNENTINNFFILGKIDYFSVVLNNVKIHTLTNNHYMVYNIPYRSKTFYY